MITFGSLAPLFTFQAVGTKMTEDEISALFRKYDKSMDGKIDIEEFQKLYKHIKGI